MEKVCYYFVYCLNNFFQQIHNKTPFSVIIAAFILAEIYFLGWLHTVFHEMGHFLACRVFKNPPPLVNICSKDIRPSRFWRETIFRIAPYPEGFTGDPNRPLALQPTPLRQIIVSVGGLGTTAVLSLASLIIAKRISAAHAGWALHLGFFSVTGTAIFFGQFLMPDSDGIRVWLAISHLIRKRPWPTEIRSPARGKAIFHELIAAVIILVLYFLLLGLFVIWLFG